jgi:hypothetical protein
MALRIAGATFAQIGAELGITSQAAQKAVRAGLKEHTREAAETLLPLEMERLDRLLLAWWQDAVTGSVAAAQLVLKIMERRAKLLGLDAPTKTDARLLARHEYDVDVDIHGGVMVLGTIRSDGNGGAVLVGGSKDDYLAGLSAARGDIQLQLEAPEAVIGTATDSNLPDDLDSIEPQD